MKTIPFSVIAASATLLTTGYGTPGSFDFPGSVDLSHPASGAPILLTANTVFERTVVIQVTFIQHEATERQKKIAQARAVAYIKKLPPQERVAMKSKKHRYIAVDTEKNAQTSSKAKKVVMVWDTQSESLVGNTVYDLPNPPPIGATAKFDTYAAEYVGGD